jgi:hypothetical protein
LLLGIAAIAVAIVATAGVSFNAAGQGAKAPAKRAPTVSFREDIVPILKGRCVDCHKAGEQGFEASGLDLTSYDGVMKGTKFGPMVIARDPESSNLMMLLDWRVDPKIRMPHGAKKLSVCDRDAMRQWIREGAQNN